MHNPNVSDSAKDRSARRLREMGSSGEASTKTGNKKGLSKSSDLHIDDTAGMWTMFFVLVDEVHTTISIEAGVTSAATSLRRTQALMRTRKRTRHKSTSIVLFPVTRPL